MLFDIDLSNVGKNTKVNNAIIRSVMTIGTIASVLTIYFWLEAGQIQAIEAEVPGMDDAPDKSEMLLAEVDMKGIFEIFDGEPSDLPGAWPAFRGADALNIAADAPPLAKSWGATGPEIKWTIPIGEGYAAPAVLNGMVYLVDYDVDRRADAIRCLSLEDGTEIWRRSYGLKIKRNHGMSRTIPAVTDKYLVSMGPKGHVVCLDAKRGDFRWGIDLQRDYGTEEPMWYTGQCPIIDDKNRAIIAPAGTDVLMMAVDCESGEVIWELDNPHGWNMSHASIMPMTVAGRDMYVYGALGGMVGVSAEPESEGQLLWEIVWDAKVVSPSAVKAGDDLIFATTGYGRGSRMLKLTNNDDGTMNVEVLYDKGPQEILACEQQTPIFHDGLLYGIMPKDAGAMKGQFACYRPDGSLVWSSGQDNRFGLGPFLLADGKFFLLDDHGTLTMIEASKTKYVQLGQSNIIDGHDAWGPLALAGSRMLLRDMNNLACVELGTS